MTDEKSSGSIPVPKSVLNLLGVILIGALTGGVSGGLMHSPTPAASAEMSSSLGDIKDRLIRIEVKIEERAKEAARLDARVDSSEVRIRALEMRVQQ